jgi:DNA mismatch repair protein MutL
MAPQAVQFVGPRLARFASLAQTMGQIRVLDGALADQIAAGEVVERPASVVKELLENALDAGARSIHVEIGEGGLSSIRVSDDGSGMDAEDAALCVLRHATSKLRTHHDLETIRTLGFRGEALPSIASVSRFRLVTRTAEAVSATSVRIDGGAAPEVSPTGAAQGTIVEVRDLFYNVPARKKFLKAPPTEGAQVSDVCLRAALAEPGLRLVLVRDGRRAREYLPAKSWVERAEAVVESRGVLLEAEQRGIQVRALLSKPEHGRTGASGLHVYVNGRAVRDRQLARSISFAYGSVLPPGRYPVGVVHLDLEPSEVDVNVHPQKAEVRFARGREVHETLTALLAKALGTGGFRGPYSRPASSYAERFAPGPVLDVTRTREEREASARASAADAQPDPWGLSGAAPAAEPPRSDLPPPSPAYAALLALGAEPAAVHDRPLVAPSAALRALCQVRNLYIVAESERGLCVLDQHAVDERVQFERIARQYRARAVQTQALLLPETVELSEREARVVEEHAAEIAATGLAVHLVHATRCAISAVPALLVRARPERLLRDLLDELTRAGERHFGDAVDTALATMACHGSIRAGDALSLRECQQLLDNLATVESFAGHCPHGRPVLMELSFDELARKVGR